MYFQRFSTSDNPLLFPNIQTIYSDNINIQQTSANLFHSIGDMKHVTFSPEEQINQSLKTNPQNRKTKNPAVSHLFSETTSDEVLNDNRSNNGPSLSNSTKLTHNYRRNKLRKSIDLLFKVFKKSSKKHPDYRKSIQALKDLNYNEAINLFTQILKEHPNSYIVRCNLAYAAYQIEDWDRAIEDLNHAISKNPRKARAYAFRGEVYRSRSMYDKALADLNKSVKIQKNSFALRSRAEVYSSTQQYEKAILDLNLALNIDPKNIFILIQRAKVRCLLGLYDEALKDLNYTLESDKIVNVSILANRGEIYRIIGHYDLALADLEAALRYEENIFALEQRGLVYRAMGNNDDALSDFERILRKNPLYFNAHKNIAEILTNLKEYKKVLIHANIILHIKPSDFQLLKIRGEAYHSLGFYDNAIKDYTSALEIVPNDGEILQKRGEIYRLLQDFEKALNDFSKVIKIDPKCVYALARRGEIYRMIRKDNQAIIDLDEAINLDPNNLMARESRGATNRMLKRYEESLEDLNEAISLNPKNVFALTNRGAVFHKLKRYHEALSDLDKALKLNPKHVFALETRGALYNSLGKYKVALTDLNNVLEMKSSNNWALAYRGDALLSLGRYDEALEDLNKVLDSLPDWDYPLSLRGAVYRALKLNTKALLDLNRAVYNALGKYNEAFADLNRVLIRDPKNVVAISELIAAYDAMGKKESALVDLENVLATDPKNVFALRKYEILRKETDIAENSTTLKKIHRTTDSDDIQFSVLTPVIRGSNKSNSWRDSNFVEISKFGSVYQNIPSGTPTTAHNKIERLFLLLEKQKDAIYHILDTQKVYVYAVELGLQQDYLMPCITCWVDEYLDKSVIEQISALFNNEYKIMDKVVGPVETDLNAQHESEKDEIRENNDGDDDKVNSCDDNKGSDRTDGKGK
ncbi:20904_t:CDS:2 [Cetraspora pellucida]|uniref:20904_t:CDS:1 n=1 Tax=Cetraspora pellucida TaxID=1433469 RepID=A0A9N9DWS1_9GLOM|nr:20904_t:CDS:2 [Cetraspora pellucida]